METIRLIFESTTPIIINNKLHVDSFPFALDWFKNANLPELSVAQGSKQLIEQCSEINNVKQAPTSPVYKIFDISSSLKLIQIISLPEKLTITQTASFFIFPKRYVVELGSDNHTSYFTIYSKSTDKLAINLNTKTGPCELKQENGKIILTASNLHFIFNPASNRVEQNKKNLHSAPIPFIFLNHLKNKDFDSAKKLLSFNISDKALSEYFGEFNILLNNYLNIPNVFSITQGDTVKNLTFTLENNKITNIE